MSTGRTPTALVAVGFSDAIGRPADGLVHVGHSALVLGRGDGLAIITAGTAGLMPGGLCVLDPAEYAGIHARMLDGRALDLADWLRRRADSLEHVDLRLDRAAIDPAATACMRDRLRIEATRARGQRGGPVPADPIRARAPRLVSLAAAPPVAVAGTDPLLAELAALIGAGPGTTPTGDDVVVGVLAGLRATGHDHAAEEIAARIPGLLPRTTRASRHYLTAACRREFGEHVHDLVRALGDARTVADAVTRARGWGASSGIDLAHGLVAAASVRHRARDTTERIA